MRKSGVVLWGVLLGLSFSALGERLQKLSSTNAHEGPVCVSLQKRLYFTTFPDYRSAYNEIHYLDLDDFTIHPFIKDANMANGMSFDKETQSLLVAEQGTKNKKGCISRISLNTKKRTVGKKKVSRSA